MSRLIQLRLWTVRAAYGVTVAVFLWAVAQCYIPGEGFTYLVMFGDANDTRALPELHATDHYVMKGTVGYDAQFYAQMAMHPRLSDPAIRRAVDNLPYRARRILFSWTASALALGDSVRALHIFPLQGVACWLLLAALLLRWFPARTFNDYVRWAGLLLSFGFCYSVRGAMLDGPSVLLIAAGMALAEAGRPWLSAAVLGVAGLGKETNVLGGAIFVPDSWRSGRDWRRAVLRGAIVLTPVVVWMVVLTWWIGRGQNTGARNFDWPFAGYLRRWGECLRDLHSPAPRVGVIDLVALAVLSVQWLFLALRPQWESRWWRLGAAYAVLMMFLGDAVWEGFPGAAGRVLLPMALAFNVLVPRKGWRWTLLLIAGNLTLWFAPTLLPPRLWDSVDIAGARELRTTPDGGRSVRVSFGAHWFPPEKSFFERWRWTDGPAEITVRNPQRFTIEADLAFQLKSLDARHVTVRAGSRTLITVALEPNHAEDVRLARVPLAPGTTRIEFDTDLPAPTPANPISRHVAFNVRHLTITLVDRDPAQPPGQAGAPRAGGHGGGIR